MSPPSTGSDVRAGSASVPLDSAAEASTTVKPGSAAGLHAASSRARYEASLSNTKRWPDPGHGGSTGGRAMLATGAAAATDGTITGSATGIRSGTGSSTAACVTTTMRPCTARASTNQPSSRVVSRTTGAAGTETSTTDTITC